ncbi:MAG: hypothetical protein OEX02_07640 [Cyclobacteriaceae bacterium]|nr:hypothetical protein [Cyclobacteriaceae bacterium]
MSVIIASLGFFHNKAIAQGQDSLMVENSDSVKLFHSNLHLMARSLGDSVILRWAPDKPGAWSYANVKGYHIDRIPINADSTLDFEGVARLTKEPLKPLPLEAWEKIVNPDDPDKYAAIAAQMLYGKTVTSPGLFQQAIDYTTRFSFTLLAADISPITADALALRFVDKNVAKGKAYLYKIYVAEASEVYTIDTAFLFVNTNFVEELPPVVTSGILELENKIQLKWNRNAYLKRYSAYYIERSEDGKNFTRLTKNPFVHILTDDFRDNESIIYQDSLPENYKPYYYRIIGISPFGELSNPIDPPYRAMGRDKTPPLPPSNVQTEYLGNNKVKITWDKPDKEPDLKGYLIGYSNTADKEGFAPLFSDPLSPDQTSYIDEVESARGTNYYLVAAVDTAGNGSSSLVSYVLVIDSIPPAPPIGLEGSIDSTGVVTVKWSLGSEPDLAGYMVFFANAKDHVFSTLSKRPLADTVFMDTITVNTLTEEIYYTVKSLDLNYNYSASSDTLMLKRPDVVPPTSPVFKNYLITKEGISLEWIPSSSKDAVKYLLFRRTSNGSDSLVAEVVHIPDSSVVWLDGNVKANAIYEYSLFTVDDAGLRSKKSGALGVKMADFSKVPKVMDLYGQVDKENRVIQLRWNYTNAEAHRFVLYRAVNGGNFQSYKSIESNTSEFNDKSVKVEYTYKYALKVHQKNGKTSKFGNIVDLEFQ